ncbi:hypothetical protein [Mycobacterium parmense]|uniref:Oxidoreductase n=1 Tax=Mycobacterium parmense TaxID=185642 RepID=A0A7I7YWS0_9MYCO|nr:hypothetical protein [Mycobacterium parmense]BBZ45414.1 hypothetical protein MPRM_26950 [Mycobacterium parmense]
MFEHLGADAGDQTGQFRVTHRAALNILLIAGTSSTAHLRENVAGAGLSLSDEDLAALDKIGDGVVTELGGDRQELRSSSAVRHCPAQ